MMKKNLKLLASAMGFIFLFYACRTDEMANSEQRAQNEKIAAFERFENLRSQEILNKKTHSSKSGVSLPLSYAQPFSEIIYQFLVNHPDFYDKLADDFGEIDYNVASQTFGEDKKYIFYPILKDGKVTSLWYGKLNEDRSWVDFYLVHDSSASTQRMIGEFQNYYSKKMASRGEPDPPVKEIPEIIITPPSTNPPIHDPIPGTGGDGTYTPPYTGDMSGGPIMHGGGTGTSTTQDPCKKLKAQNTPDFKGKLNLLESNLDDKKETGYIEKKNGTFEYKDNASATEDANSLTLGDPTSDMKGFLHTHPNDFEDSDGNTRIGFKIFSPADVIYFTQLVSLANQNGTPIEDVYAVMVSGKGNYQIRFTGNANQIKTTYTNTKIEYREMYKTYFKENSKRTDETNFLKFMEEMMYVKGVTLVKMNSDGTTVKKTLNSTKTGVTDTPCS
ncbi:hypothetical protein [Chryseobacterium taeanense]|uniref:hypothetical protein n=1 Tax=Chryseobacterium taeanense TaxID=311334 RepID=UPI0035AF83DC